MAVDYTIIGERIKKARKAKQITHETLAEQIGVSIAFLSRIERGNSQVNIKRLSQICKILDLTEGEILNGSSTGSNSYLNAEFARLLESCSSEQQKLIYEIAKIIANQNS